LLKQLILLVSIEIRDLFFSDLQQIVEAVAANLEPLGVESDSILELSLFFDCRDWHSAQII